MNKQTWLLAAAILVGATLHSWGGETAAPVAGQPILDTHGFWRCFFVMREPVYGTSAQDAKPQPPAEKGPSYRYHTDLPPANWIQPDFDDSEWGRRPGPFFAGYGFKQPQTLGLICLRGTFAVPDPAQAGGLTVRAAFRGGLVVYVNGKEIARRHLPDGANDLEALAEIYPETAHVTPDGAALTDKNAGQGDNKSRCEQRLRRLESVAIPAAALRKGVNVLAIELHRAPYHNAALTAKDAWAGLWSTTGLLDVEVAGRDREGVVANLVRPKGVQAWNADPITPVFDVDYGDPNTPLQPIRIVGTRNGTFSGQVVIGSDAPIKGLQAAMSDLKQTGGNAAIPATAVRVRFAAPGGSAGGAGDRYPGIRDVTTFDTLDEAPPAEVPVFKKEMARNFQGRLPVFGALQPVWVTVGIPASAVVGDYTGLLTIALDGGDPIRAPVHLKVCEWTLPASRDFVMHADLVESPESVAMRYGLPLWSEEHFKRVGRSLEMLGQVANKTIYIQLIAKTNHGNSETMIRWVKQADGSLKPDYAIMEKYLDLYIEKAGKPQFVIFYVSDAYTGQGYFGGADSKRVKKTGVKVSVLDAGNVVEFEGPGYDDREAAKAFWRPAAEGIRERLKKRGLENAWHIGLASDRKPNQPTVAVWKDVAPEAKWVQQGHGLDGAYGGVTVGYNTTVWKGVYATDPSVGRTYGWNLPKKVAYFHRDIHRMEAIAQMLESRLVGEKNIQGKQCGFGRFNADFWPVLKDPKTGKIAHTISSRYPETTWAQCNINMTAYLAPGPEGAIATTRFEMIREGIEECEARIFIEKSLIAKELRTNLGEERAKRLQDMLDARTRAIICASGEMGTQWYAGSGWRMRSEKLFTAAGEVAQALGGSPGKAMSDGASINAYHFSLHPGGRQRGHAAWGGSSTPSTRT